jgi:hypothetical protein
VLSEITRPDALQPDLTTANPSNDADPVHPHEKHPATGRERNCGLKRARLRHPISNTDPHRGGRLDKGLMGRERTREYRAPATTLQRNRARCEAGARRGSRLEEADGGVRMRNTLAARMALNAIFVPIAELAHNTRRCRPATHYHPGTGDEPLAGINEGQTPSDDPRAGLPSLASASLSSAPVITNVYTSSSRTRNSKKY